MIASLVFVDVFESSYFVGGQASTILDLQCSPPCLLRPGRVSREQIEAVLKKNIYEFS